MSLPVAILAGGEATRLRPVTDNIPKCLIEVARQPFLFWQLNWLLTQGARRVVICAGRLGQMVEDAVDDQITLGRWQDLEIVFSHDGSRALGTGGALMKALGYLGDRFLVMQGDTHIDCSMAAVERAFVESGKSGLMTVYRNRDQWDRSNVVFRDGRIYVYDKHRHSSLMEHIDYGLCGLTATAFRAWPHSFDVARLFEYLLLLDQLAAYEVEEGRRFYNIGDPAGLREAQAYFGRSA